jgi:hypothetical protein
MSRGGGDDAVGLGERLRIREHRLAIIVGVSAVLEAGAAGLLVSIVGWEKISRGLHLDNAEWFAVCLVGQLVAYAGYTLAFRALARVDDGPRIGVADAAAVVAAGFAPVFTADPAGGFAVDKAALRAAGAGRKEAVRRVVALGGLEYAVLAPVAAVCGVLAVLGIGGRAPLEVGLPWLALVPGVVLAAWLTQPRRAERLAALEGGPLGVKGAFGHAVGGLALLRGVLFSSRRDTLALAGIALYWLGDIGTLAAALAAFDVDFGPTGLVLGYATGYALTRRALPLGGPGAVEFLLPLALSWVYTSFSVAFAAVFAYRFFNFWLSLVPGLVAVTHAGALERRLARARA